MNVVVRVPTLELLARPGLRACTNRDQQRLPIGGIDKIGTGSVTQSSTGCDVHQLERCACKGAHCVLKGWLRTPLRLSGLRSSPHHAAPRSEGVADRNVRRIAPTRNQYPTDTWDVVASIEDVPATAGVGLEPGGEIHGTIRRRHANVAEVASQ